MNKPTTKQVLKYMLLPQLGRRFRSLSLNFSYLAFLMAQVLASVRLIPVNHPYTRVANMERFGIRDVLAVAASRLKFDWNHSDQILFFGLIILTIAILILQFVGIILFLGTGVAHAAPEFLGFFATNPPDRDIAFMIMDRVFGVPNVFMSEFSPNARGFIGPLQQGLHALLAFYSRAMLGVGVLIVLYYMFAITVESAQTGVPFGERFAKIYAPVRLCLAILLLLPLAYGFNLGQYFTLYVAKWGSSFATNTWKVFNMELRNPINADPENLLVIPNAPDLMNVIQFYSIAATCREAYDVFYEKDVQSYLVRTDENGTQTIPLDGVSGISYRDALTFYEGGNISIVYGEQNSSHSSYPGNIRPYCGKVTIPTSSIDRPFAVDIYSAYFDMVRYLWASDVLEQFGRKFVYLNYSSEGDPCSIPNTVEGYNWGSACDQEPSLEYLLQLLETQQANFNALVANYMDIARRQGFQGFNAEEREVIERGWGGAGLWFNKIADVNGAIVAAVYDSPQVREMPEIMEFIKAQRFSVLNELGITDQYNPRIESGCSDRDNNQATPQDCFGWSSGDRLRQDRRIAEVFYRTHNFYAQELPRPERRTQDPGVIGQMLGMMFGAEGLYDIRENSDIHPLAQMTVMGRSIMESTVRNLAIGTGISLVAGAVDGAYNGTGPGIQGIAGVFYAFGTAAMTIGFLLYYVIPMLPFMYFFFGVGKWVQTIFEAIVAVPLWALAHLKIDGDGLAGPAAANGYFLILEIFIRPVLVIVGMIAAISIFTAAALVMNDLWDLVTVNVTGYNSTEALTGSAASIFEIEYYREGVDVFFFTLLYVIVVYMMAMSAFKMIDEIPNNILRWMNQAVKSFSDTQSDPADTLIRFSAIGGGTLGGEMTDILKEGSYAISNNTVGAAASRISTSGG